MTGSLPSPTPEGQTGSVRLLPLQIKQQTAIIVDPGPKQCLGWDNQNLHPDQRHVVLSDWLLLSDPQTPRPLAWQYVFLLLTYDT